MSERPKILSRRSSQGAHEFVISLPDGPAEAAKRFAAVMGIHQYEVLPSNRMSFTLEPGQVLTNFVRAAFSGRLAGYAVVRALMDPESFPDERDSYELSARVQPQRDHESGTARTSFSAARLKPAVAIGVAFFLGMIASSILNDAPAPAARAGEDALLPAVPEPSSVQVELGTFVAARGPAAAFTAEDGTLRYAVASGSLEGRLGPETEVWVEIGIRPAVFTPIRELRDPDGAYVFRQPPMIHALPALDRYEALSTVDLTCNVEGRSAEDSTRCLYLARAEWREAASAPMRLKGELGVEGDVPVLRLGAITIHLIELDEVDRLNLSLVEQGSGSATVYGTVAEEFPWDVFRFEADHPAFSMKVDWIVPGRAPEMADQGDPRNASMDLPLRNRGEQS